MRRIFRNPEQQRLFEEKGFEFHDFLGPEEIAKLRELYESTAGAGHETHDFATKLSYYISIFDTNPENRRAANDAIRTMFEDKIDDILIDYRILYCNFMVKEPHGGEIQAHQDYTWVDESQHVAFNLWVPLEDTDLSNGCFHMVPGSHRLIRDSFRAGSIADTLVAHNEALKPYMVPTPVRAGRGIVFDHRLFHYSPDNLSGTPRLAAQLVLIPRDARPVMAHYDAERDPGHVRLLEIPSDEFLFEHNLWEAPPDELPVVDSRPYRRLPDEAELIDMVRDLGTAPELSAPSMQPVASSASIGRRKCVLFRDKRHQESFDENGYVIVDLLEQRAVDALLELYSETVADLPQVDLFESSRHCPLDLNMRIMHGLRKEIEGPASRLFAGGTLFGGTFMVKVPRNSNRMPLHQDWSIVEEDRFQSAFMWCALVEVTPERGGLYVLPGSHRYFDNIRSGNMPSVRIEPDAPLQELLVDITLQPGQAIIYSDQLFHGSYANRTSEPRIVCTGRINEEGSSLVFYHQTGEDEVAVIAASPEFYLEEIDSLAKGELPEGSTVVKTINHRYLAVTKDVMLSRLGELGMLTEDSVPA